MDTETIIQLGSLFSASISRIIFYPLERVIHIRQGLPQFEYRNVISCLKNMPREQGGGTQIWRGLAPWFCATIASRPCAMLANNQVRNISLFQTNQSTPFGEKLVKSVAAGATSGGIVIFALHPLHMASLRLQLDVGGGTLGSRASFKNTKQVLSQIAKQSGVFSTPFSTSGSVYRGFGGTCAHAILHCGLYFGLYDTFRKFGGGSLFANFFVGFAVSNTADFLSYPIKTGTVRAQAAVSPTVSVDGVVTTVQYRGAFHAMATVAKTEGVTALWRGYGLALGKSIFGTMGLIGYDMLKMER